MTAKTDEVRKQYESETGKGWMTNPVCHGEMGFASWEYQTWLESKVAAEAPLLKRIRELEEELIHTELKWEWRERVGNECFNSLSQKYHLLEEKVERMESVVDAIPENPYPEDLFPATIEEYESIVPDKKSQSVVGGVLGRRMWKMFYGNIEEIKKILNDNDTKAER